MTIIILNALPQEWNSSVSNIYTKKETSSFDELWSECVMAESKLRKDTKWKDGAHAVEEVKEPEKKKILRICSSDDALSYSYYVLLE